MLKDYRGRFPFRLATTSYIYPDKVVPNVAKLAPFFDEIELVFFESESRDNLLHGEELKALTDLSSDHGLKYNIHLPLDLFLGDKREAVRTKGISAAKGMIARTLALNPSVYTLHLDTFDGVKAPFLNRGKKRRSVSTLSPRPELGPKGIRRALVRQAHPLERSRETDRGVEWVDSENLSGPAFDRRGKEGKGVGRGEVERWVLEPDVEGWRMRLSRSLEEILSDGIEAKRISIETLGYPFEWVEDIVERFEFSICLDIGHLLSHGQDLRSYLERYLPKASIIHLHGFEDGMDHLGIDRLSEPALGLVLSHLHDYRGIVSFEVFSIEDLKRSLTLLEEKWEKR